MNAVYPLFSSSKGNAIYVGNKDRGVLIDAGVSYKRLSVAMARCGLCFENLKAVFITHVHTDHVKGIPMLVKKHALPVYAREKTLNLLSEKGIIGPACNTFEVGSCAVEIFGMKITAFDTPHDTIGSCGYRIDFEDGRSCAVCTDLGHITPEVDSALMGADTVLIEANYDDEMIHSGPYPLSLIRRICSENGHLSNHDSAAQILRLVENGTKNIILGHLSQENNSPPIAEHTISKKLSAYEKGRDYMLTVAAVETFGDMVVV
ncbi:MAG: MBL fold metallo-hydrolase [Oscillospiraceae bacterium]|nr:MBL fold metallo-hydrolase [Oscillospiraceae bacterium]